MKKVRNSILWLAVVLAIVFAIVTISNILNKPADTAALPEVSINRPVLDTDFTTIRQGNKPLLIVGINREGNLFEIRYHDEAILSINDEGLITGIKGRQIAFLNEDELSVIRQMFGYYMWKNETWKLDLKEETEQ